jgi:hypothetical protein
MSLYVYVHNLQCTYILNNALGTLLSGRLLLRRISNFKTCFGVETGHLNKEDKVGMCPLIHST